MKKYTMQDFINEKIAVRIGNKYGAEFMKMCEDANLRWITCGNASNFVPSIYGDKQCVAFNCCGDNRLGHETEKWYTKEGWKVIDFHDIASHRKYMIILESEGDITTARMIINGKEVKTAKATRNPDDKFNWKMGAQLAFDRLWGEKKDKVKEVKRPAKVGEYIKLIEPEFSFNKKGDILLVTSIATSGNPNVLEKDHPQKVRKAPVDKGWCYDTSCFVVLEGYKPNK